MKNHVLVYKKEQSLNNDRPVYGCMDITICLRILVSFDTSYSKYCLPYWCPESPEKLLTISVSNRDFNIRGIWRSSGNG